MPLRTLSPTGFNFCVGVFSGCLLFASSLRAQSTNDPNRPPSAPASQRAAQHNPQNASQQSAANGPSGDEKILFDHLNQSRAQAGLPALVWDAKLADAARKHCALMVQQRALSHQFSGEADLKERLQQAQAEFSVAAENVALAQSADQIHDQWMHSAPHRANILARDVNAVGIAEMPGGNSLYAVEDFAQAVESLSLPQQEEKIRNLLAAAGMNVVGEDKTADARKSCQTGKYSGPNAAFARFDSSDLNRLPPNLKPLLTAGQYHSAAVGACDPGRSSDGFTHYRVAVLFYP